MAFICDYDLVPLSFRKPNRHLSRPNENYGRGGNVSLDRRRHWQQTRAPPALIENLRIRPPKQSKYIKNVQKHTKRTKISAK